VCDGVPVMVKIDSAEYPYVLLDQRQAFLVEPKSPVGDVLRWKVNRHMWILTDARASPDGIPNELLVPNGPAPMFVYSSSPRRARWALANQYDIRQLTIIMNPWSKWEAELLIKLLGLSPGLGYYVNWAKSQEVFKLDSPIPHLFIEKVAFSIGQSYQ